MNQTPTLQCNAGSESPMNSVIKELEVFTSKYEPLEATRLKLQDLEPKHASAPSRALAYKSVELKKSRLGRTTTVGAREAIAEGVCKKELNQSIDLAELIFLILIYFV